MDLAFIANWLEDNKEALLWTTIGSIAAIVITVVVAVVLIVKAPADYFQQQKRQRSTFSKNRPGRALALRIARNILGWLLIAAGVAMLVLPGQGILVIIIGVALADCPGKYRIQRWLISRGRVLKTANWLRAKFDKPPLEVDHAGQSFREPAPAPSA